MDFNQKDMGKRIREERKRNKLTIERLCEIMDVSPSFIGLVERGVSGISLEKLCKLSDVLQVSTDYLLKGEEPERRERLQRRTNMEILNARLYNYTEDELLFLIELIEFLRQRVEIKR